MIRPLIEILACAVLLLSFVTAVAINSFWLFAFGVAAALVLINLPLESEHARPLR
jgi:hypothetical protein